MARIARPAQVADDAVGAEIDDHAGDEQRTADPDVGTCEPTVVVAGGGDVEDPAALHQGVERIEYHPHQNDSQRHLRPPADQQREDEGPLQVMALEEDEKCQRSRFECTVGAEPQDAHGDEDGRLHRHPSDTVGNARPEFSVEEVAVSRFDEMECDEHRECEYGHRPEEKRECFVHNVSQRYE